eukprot:scaffold349799_cov18-Prasinocladus_malaysianus.AAC.1
MPLKPRLSCLAVDVASSVTNNDIIIALFSVQSDSPRQALKYCAVKTYKSTNARDITHAL